MNSLKLINSLTRKKEVFKPNNIKKISLYACGPTVYDRAHIGNARNVIMFDVLFRLLRHVWNINLVVHDDSISARASLDLCEFTVFTKDCQFRAVRSHCQSVPPPQLTPNDLTGPRSSLCLAGGTAVRTRVVGP